MLVYVYDGTIEGLFCAFEKALTASSAPGGFTSDSRPGGSMDLFCSDIEVPTDTSRAGAFGDKLHKLDRRLPGDLIRAFLSEQPEVEMLMFNFLKKIKQFGGGVRGNLMDPTISNMRKLLKRIGGETHRMKGFLRFEELEDGLLWANYEPAFNISMLLVPHFAARLRNQRWVICDVFRGIAIYYDGQSAQPVELAPGVLDSLRQRGQLPGRRRNSDRYVDLWRQFFKSVAIQERKNPKLQRNFMPKRFWKWLPEKD